jgi:molybdopterin-guanine dinucleotide biosynthesis protein A
MHHARPSRAPGARARAVSAPDGFLLAGGRSVRMGRDKALLELGEERFVERIARALRPHVGAIRLVGRGGDWCGMSGVEDLRPGWGPLAGIETALASAGGGAAFLVACDLPLVSSALLALLANRAALAPDSIVVPIDAGGRVAPLCGIYPGGALPLASRLLDAGERRPRALLDRFPAVLIGFDEYAHLPGAKKLLLNVNTPDEYRAVLDLGL